ncbi:uncharacterized protein [Dysidea avara]
MKHDQSITLHNVLEVCDKEQNISGRPVFQIIFTKCEHQFLAESTEEMERWIVVLQQEIFGLPIQGVTYEFQVGVHDNPTARRYNLMGRYLAKIDDIKLTLYSACGNISTNFSVNIADIWRVKIALECTNNSVDSNFVVIDITCKGAILLTSDCSTDIARVINHRRRLLNSGSQSVKHGKAFSLPYHGSPAVIRKYKAMFDYSNSKEDGYLELYIDHDFQISTSTLSTRNGLERQSQMHSVSRQSSSEEPHSPTVSIRATSCQRTSIMSSRPPEPVPRSPYSLLRKPLCTATSCPIEFVRICKKSTYGDECKRNSGENGYVRIDTHEDDGDYDYPYVLEAIPIQCQEHVEPDYVSKKKIINFQKMRTRHGSLEDLCNMGRDKREGNQSPYYVNDDAIINLRRLQKPENKHTSLKGCKSLDEVYPYLDMLFD